MLFKIGQTKCVTINKRNETMKSKYSIAPWSLSLGILGLAISASPAAIGLSSEGGSASPDVHVTTEQKSAENVSKDVAVKAAKPTQKVKSVSKEPKDAYEPSVPTEAAPVPLPAPVADSSSDSYPFNKVAAARIPEGKATITTIEGALEAAYRNNTELKELQSLVRSKDDGVPQALAGWRPTVYLNASIGGEKDIKSGDIKEDGDEGLTLPQSGSNFSTASADITLQQNLFNGGKTVAQTCQAESLVLAARAQMADKEREILFNAVRAYFSVIAKASELDYKKSNELALRKTLEATQDKFNVGEETRTSIAQAQANLAMGKAEREAVEAQLLAAEATFEQVTGARPGKLKKPGEPESLPRALKDAIEIAKKNNPGILAVLYQERADRSAIKVNEADLLPKVDLTGAVERRNQNTSYAFPAQGSSTVRTKDFTTAQRVSVNLRVPIYEAGAIRGKTRELRENAEQRRIMIETKRREIIQRLVEAWETYLAAKANVKNYQTQVKSNEVSLEGTRQEMLVGSKILLDVLNEQQKLVQSQTNLVRAEQQYYESAYSVLANMGRLNALDMKLKVKRYNPEIHYRDVRNSW